MKSLKSSIFEFLTNLRAWNPKNLEDSKKFKVLESLNPWNPGNLKGFGEFENLENALFQIS